ncbi:hypothetical protein L211DRAFT_834615 [Terfezia boudieri ATCC MYA-4762]|uniref:Chromo domain-containing protein n=1 Tax=Terfezia boudieri ATCC MYA-4762 TaxID=1051890 RepID=A0A3N4LVN8_9PEZI|nr:hypothetical protein L211DRAFT_834615 [Terfezia boudieri ATCC MYA-4762]
MASTISSLAHTHLTTSKIYHTRTRQTSVNYQLDEDTTGGSPNSTQGTAGPWYEVKEIIGEKKDKYKILWAGVDPKTNKPWKADWVGISVHPSPPPHLTHLISPTPPARPTLSLPCQPEELEQYSLPLLTYLWGFS